MGLLVISFIVSGTTEIKANTNINKRPSNTDYYPSATIVPLPCVLHVFTLSILLDLLVQKRYANSGLQKCTCLAGGLILAVSKIAMAILSIHVILQSHFLCLFVVTSEIYYLI